MEENQNNRGEISLIDENLSELIADISKHLLFDGYGGKSRFDYGGRPLGVKNKIE